MDLDEQVIGHVYKEGKTWVAYLDDRDIIGVGFLGHHSGPQGRMHAMEEVVTRWAWPRGGQEAIVEQAWIGPHGRVTVCLK